MIVVDSTDLREDSSMTNDDEIIIPDPSETYVLFTDAGYVKGLLSYLPSTQEGEEEEMMYSPRSMSFVPVNEQGMDMIYNDHTHRIHVKEEHVEDVVYLYAGTLGVSPITDEPLHISEIVKGLDHVYDENSQFYPQDGEPYIPGADEEDSE